MIPQRELAALRSEWTLDQGVIEKDYILGWLLACIANHDALSRTWIFKGGTCLRKCYYETFRFSEDLDFTVVDGGPRSPTNWSGSSLRSRTGSAKSLGSRLPSTRLRSGVERTSGIAPPPKVVSRT